MKLHKSKSCIGEYCSMCKAPAALKVGEEIMHDEPFPNRHNFTAYVCEAHGNWILFGIKPEEV